MVDAVTSADVTAVQESDAPYGRCQVCRSPLPEPMRRSDGKYKGGRRRLYCPAPRDCKERAQAMREARVAEALGDPLKLVAAVADEAVPALKDAQAVLVRALEGFAAVTDVTREEVAQARADAAEARDEAADARRRAGEAEDRAVQAAARAERERAARQEADAMAAAAREEAAETKRQAAETVAAHRQAAVQAERAAALSKQAEEALAVRLETVTGRLDAEVSAREGLAAELADCRADLAAARTSAQAADAAREEIAARLARCQAEARTAARAADAERAAHERIAGDLTRCQADLAAARTAAEAAAKEAAAVAERADRNAQALVGQVEDLRREAERARLEAHGLRARVETLESDREAARAEAAHQRERAVQAELRARDQAP